MEFRFTRRTIVLPIVLLAVAACSGADSTLSSSDVTDLTASAYRTSEVRTIRVDPAQAKIATGANVKLVSNVYDSQGRRITGFSGIVARWVSSDTTVATVSASGVVHGVRSGVVSIKAVAGVASGSGAVTVGDGAPAASSPPTPAVPSTPPTSAPSAPSTPAQPTPPSTPVQPTPPAIPGNGSGLSGLALISDDFTKYSSTADLVANISTIAGGPGDYHTVLYTDGHSPSLVALDKSVLYNGHPTMKYNQPGGSGSTPEMWPSFPHGQTLSKVWVRAKIRWSPGYTTTGTLTNSANAYKLLAFGFAGSNGRAEVGITNTTQYQVAWNSVSTQTGQTLANSPFAMAGNIAQEWSDGGWYDYIFCYEVLSPTSARVRFWIARDGQTPVLRATAVGGPTVPGAAMPVADRVLLGQNFNQVRTTTQSQALWYGQWEVIDGSQHPDPYGLH